MNDEKMDIESVAKLMKIHKMNVKRYIGNPDYGDKLYSKNRILKLIETMKDTCSICGETFINHSGRFKKCPACKKKTKTTKTYNVCTKCGRKFYADRKEKLCHTCNTELVDPEDPYGVMVKPQYRGRKCICGIPLPTGKHRCDNCKIHLGNFNEDFLIY